MGFFKKLFKNCPTTFNHKTFYDPTDDTRVMENTRIGQTMLNYKRATDPVSRVVDFAFSKSLEEARASLSAGDHIACNRSVYSHHGIYDGNGCVYEYNEGVIRCVSLRSFADGDNILKIKSDVKYSSRDIILRAKSRIGEHDYNLIFNNCEHFARWCRNGEYINLSSFSFSAIPTPDFNDFHMGDVVEYGSWYQESSSKKTPIEWYLIDTDYRSALLLSKYALYTMPFNNLDRNDTDNNKWRYSLLRKWLNTEFLSNAFSVEDRSIILETETERNCKDKIFVLSVKQAAMFVEQTNFKYCTPTQYAKSNGAFYDHNHCIWWLRSEGTNSQIATAYFDYIGVIGKGGAWPSSKDICIRPSLVVSKKYL